ncbi:MAG: F0F1 ATP synthase subunit alpha, partial [bacterium]
LPIIETQMGDISAYIPTNIISITDGQIFLDNNLFNAGFRPAVNVGMSVSRVGGKAQTRAMRRLSGRLRIDMAQFRERQSFALFASELDRETKIQLQRGQVLNELLKQVNCRPMPVAEQVIMFYLGVKGFLDTIPPAKAQLFESRFMDFVRLNQNDLITEIEETNDYSQAWEDKLGKLAFKFKEQFKNVESN